MRVSKALSSRLPVAIEGLESRRLLSASVPTSGLLTAIAGTGTAHHIAGGASAQVAKVATVKTATKLTLSKHSATLGTPVLLTVTVKATGQKVTPTGTVTITDNGANIDLLSTPLTLTLVGGKASYSLSVGNRALSLGSHQLKATYTSDASLPTSTSAVLLAKTTVGKAKSYSSGLVVGTAQAGKGPAIAVGQTATVYYTGFLATTGQVFDYSDKSGTLTPFRFVVGANPESVITGFDAGVLGMKVGETRFVGIPSALGYGATGSFPNIPANADLIFLIKLVSIGS